jgi:regulator of protease activity HflC (stomatin/prohibitin superfamily)
MAFTFFLFCTLGLFILTSVKILKEYERGVIFFLGRFWKVKGPGLIIVVPIIQEMARVQLRTVVLDIPPQDIITKDNISVRVNAVVYYYIFNPERAIIKVESFFEATSQLAQTTLRSVLGEHELDDLLSKRESLNASLRDLLDKQTDEWGLKITNVEIKDIDINESMIRAIAQQAEAERTRRSKIILAEGELQASQKLLEASQTLEKSESALFLRYLQTLADVANERTSTIIFPIEMMKKVKKLLNTEPSKD